jgi:preprotein translocase subunit YajC
MEMLILFCVVVVPLSAFGLFAMYKAQQEERKEQEAELNAQNSLGD